MKSGRFVICLLLGFIVFCLSAKSADKEQVQEGKMKTLWVVDGVALNDSVFGFTLEQMRSDSAAVLASRVLSWVYERGIDSISVIDSISAAERGYVNCNGVVKIVTTIREPLLVVINGYPYNSKEKASAGEVLGGYEFIQRILQNEFDGLKDCGIKEGIVLRQMRIGFHYARIPLVIITTELPYFRADIFEGKYTGKRGRQSYELTLNTDSTYVFSKKINHKKSITPEIHNFGTWSISGDEIFLFSSQDPTILLQGCTMSLDTVRLKINSAKVFTLPKNSWDNKKSVTLRRQYNEI